MNRQNRKGFRGYMGARMAMGRSVPQNVQQMVMREYCRARNMAYLLAGVEYRMEGCTMILDALMTELPRLEGIVMYSLCLLPESRTKRLALYDEVFEQGCTLHFAAESIAVSSKDEALQIEDIWLVAGAMRGQSEADFAYLAKGVDDAAA